jgi:hypothetical protein
VAIRGTASVWRTCMFGLYYDKAEWAVGVLLLVAIVAVAFV